MTFDELWGKSTPNSWARVPRGTVAMAVGSLLFGTTGFMATTTIAGVSLATMTGFLITTAITTWAMSALAPKPGSGGSSRGLLSNNREAAGAFDIVYGEVRKGGVITFMETSDRIDSKGKRRYNDYLHTIIVLAGHEVAEIGNIYLNDEVVSIDANGYVTGDRWRSLIRIKKHTGSPNQTVDPDLLAETSVTNAFRGRGIAYLYVRMDWDTETFSSGTPTITAQVKGKKVFDPRNSTTAWSDNAALCIRDYLEQPFGVNSIQSPASLLSNSWNIGANVCDSVVTKKDGSTEKRYTINGVLSTGTAPRDNIQKMLTACGGTLFWGQGQWQFKAGYFPSGPYVSFNSGDLRSGIDLVTKNSRKENFNAVTGLFVDKNQGYTEVEYPKISSPIFLARDNGQDNVLDVSLPLTVSASAAQRLGKMAMFRNREEIVIGADFSPKAANVKVGDVVQFTLDRYGFNNKFFEVLTWKPIAEDGELKFSLVLKETSAAAYDWNAEEQDILGNNTILPNPLAELFVTNLTVSNNQVLQKDGTYIGQVTLSWDEAGSAFVERYDVQWKRGSETNWSSTTTVESSIVIPSIVSGALYNYRVRAVSAAGFTGPWEALSTTVVGKTQPAGVPTGLKAEGAYRSVNLSWANPTDRDLSHVEVFKGVNQDGSGATLLGKSGGTTFVDGPITPNVARWYFVRSVDYSGNKSAFSAGVQGTALFVENSDVDIDVKELLSDAGLSAVEVLGALPTTDNFNGRTVYLTTDKQIYTWNGSAWESTSSKFNGVLKDINFPTNLRPIEVVSALPTTGNFQGRVVFRTTDNKLYRRTGNAWTAAVPAGDVTGQITSTQISDSAITTPKLAANAVEAGNIATNAIYAGAIQAGAVAASKMAIGDFTNLVPDFDISDPAAWTIPNSWTRSLSGDAYGGKYWVTAPATPGTNSPSVTSKRFSVDIGKEYFVSLQARSHPDDPSGVRLNCYVNFFDKAGTLVSRNPVVPYNYILQNLVQTLSGSITIPAGVTECSVGWYIAAGSSAGTAYVGAPSCRLKATGQLIVDGAITANHMTVNSVTAGVIAAGAINAAALFVDGVITAAKLNVNHLSAITTDLGQITAGALNINNNFIVNGQGQVTIRSGSLNINNRFVVGNDGSTVIRSGTTGERMVISNNRIDVFDSSGTLRVRMGQL